MPRQRDRNCEGCERKEVYTLAVARRIARAINRKQEKEPVAEYHCNRHHGWHVGGLMKLK